MRKSIFLSIAFLLVFCFWSGCAVSGSVVNHGQIQTPLKSIRLESGRSLKILCGRSIREISLRQVKTIKIDPKQTVSYNWQLFFAAEIDLKDGTRITDNGKDDPCYISVQDAIIGRNKGEHYKINLDMVKQVYFK